LQITPSQTPEIASLLSATAKPFGAQNNFSKLFSPNDTATDRAAKPQEDQALQAAQDLVSITLLQPLLAQARQDPFKSDLFHGGFAEDAFGDKMDSITAQQIAQRTNFPIVDAVYNWMMNAGTKVNTHG